MIVIIYLLAAIGVVFLTMAILPTPKKKPAGTISTGKLIAVVVVGVLVYWWMCAKDYLFGKPDQQPPAGGPGAADQVSSIFDDH